MRNFFNYCFYCLGLVFDAAFGNNPSGLTTERMLVGTAVLFVGLGLLLGIAFALTALGRASVKKRKNKQQNNKEQK